MGLFKRKKKENKQSSTEKEQDKKVEKAVEESAEPTPEKKTDEKQEQEKKPGFFASKWQSVKTGSKKLVKKGKKAFQKEPDDMSDTEFDERLQSLEAEGETGYASRYYALIDELKNMPSLVALTKQAEPEDVAEAVSENPTLEEGEKEEAKEAAESPASETADPAAKTAETSTASESETAVAPEAAEPEKTETSVEAESEVSAEVKQEAETPAESKASEPAAENSAEEKNTAAPEEKTEKPEAAGETAEQKSEEKEAAAGEETKDETASSEDKASVTDKLLTMKDDALNAGKSGMSIVGSYQRSKALAKLSENADISTTKGRKLSYMKGQADIETSNNSFDTAANVVNLVNKAIGQFGSSALADIAGKISGFVNMALSFGKGLMAKRLEKKSVKNGLKGLLGGTEVYNKLKTKYKMHGGDMRRAIRVAANRSSVQDLVNADKDKLSEEYAEDVKSKNGAADQYMGLAGGRDAASIKKAMGGKE